MKRLLLSIFLIFHLFGVLVAPNPTSYLYIAAAPIYKPYMNGLGLGNTWSFFAPEPVFPQMFLDYVIEYKDGQTARGRFPDEENTFFFRDRHNRRMSMARFIMAQESNWQNMFVNYLCAQNKEASAIKLWRMTGQPPSLEMVRSGEKKATDAVNFKIDILGTYYCKDDKDAPLGT